MDVEKVLITLFIAFFGWLLNELSQFFRYKKEDKKTANQALFYLIDLKFILEQTKDIIAAAKNHEELSPIAKRSFNSLVSDERLNSSSFGQNLEESVKLVSKIDPLLAQEMRVSVEGAEIFKKDYLKFNNERKMPSTDKEFLDLNYQSLEAFAKNIDKFTRTLAFRKSKITWLRMHLRRWENTSKPNELWSRHFSELNKL